MMAQGVKARDRVLKIYNILKDCDSSTPVTIKGLQELLADEEEIDVSIRTLADDIAVLKKNGLIRSVSQKGASKDDRGSYGLFDDSYFELWETKILMDSVSQVPYIPLDTVKTLRSKLLNLTSKRIREQAGDITSELPEQMYSTTDEFIYTLKEALRAIIGGKVLEFRYSRLDENKEYREDRDYAQIVHPYAITTLDDYFYLLGYYEQRESVSPFRLDRIKKIKVTDRDATPAARLPIGDKTEDIRNYLVNNTSNFMHEKKALITIKWHPEKNHVSLLYDIMGTENVSRGKGENEYIIKTDNNPGLIANLLRLGPTIELLGPESGSVKKAYLNELRSAAEYYK